MYTVTLFFVPWDNPDDVLEFETVGEVLEDIDVYGVPMIDAATLVKKDLPLDTTFHMLRSVKDGGTLLETETCSLSTGSSAEAPLVLEGFKNIQKMMNLIDNVAQVLKGLS